MSRIRAVLVVAAGVSLVWLGYWAASREVRAMTAEVARLGGEIGGTTTAHPLPTAVLPQQRRSRNSERLLATHHAARKVGQ